MTPSSVMDRRDVPFETTLPIVLPPGWRRGDNQRCAGDVRSNSETGSAHQASVDFFAGPPRYGSFRHRWSTPSGRWSTQRSLRSKETIMRVTLTDRSLSKLAAPTSGQIDYFDKTVPGFALRVSANGARSWIVRYRRHGRKQRVTLGPEDALSLADARAKAKDMLARVR